MLGLIPCAIIFSLATETNLGQSCFVSIWLGLAVAWVVGVYCGELGWWLTRNSTLDSRLMACALSVVLELTILGWLLVMRLQPGMH